MPVDSGIVDAVTALRLLDIHTISSCEGHIGRFTSGPNVVFCPEQADDLAENRDDAIRMALYEIQKLTPYLEDFYKNRNTPHTKKLIIQFFPPSFAMLKCHNAELIYNISDKETQKEVLNGYQSEMNVFATYLKQKLCGVDEQL